ncbi:MAG: hypothetical protein ACOYIK_08605 [Coriobacteriales bacterium]
MLPQRVYRVALRDDGTKHPTMYMRKSGTKSKMTKSYHVPTVETLREWAESTE